MALLAHVKFTRGEPGPHLVVAPLSVLSAWTSEFHRFCPALRVLKLHSSDGAERARLMATVEDCDAYDVAITTPEMAKAPNVQTRLAHRSWWNYLVIDEGKVRSGDSGPPGEGKETATL
ncbi:SNF2-related protein [bacterium]|nr:SNF2-related protein [bacterium]